MKNCLIVATIILLPLIIFSIVHSIQTIRTVYQMERVNTLFLFNLLIGFYFFSGFGHYLLANGYNLDKIKIESLVLTLAFLLLMIAPVVFNIKRSVDMRTRLVIFICETVKIVGVELMFSLYFYFFWELPLCK